MRAHEAITVDSSPLLARGASKRATTYSELASDLDGGASARSSWTRATKLFLGTAAVAGIVGTAFAARGAFVSRPSLGAQQRADIATLPEGFQTALLGYRFAPGEIGEQTFLTDNLVPQGGCDLELCGAHEYNVGIFSFVDNCLDGGSGCVGLTSGCRHCTINPEQVGTPREWLPACPKCICEEHELDPSLCSSEPSPVAPPSPDAPSPPSPPAPPAVAAFGSNADLKAAVESCLSVGDGTGEECCSTHGANCGVAGEADMPLWNTAGITDMSSLFSEKTTFNEDISGWDVSSVTTLHKTFFQAKAFNQPIGSWDVSSVTNMDGTFYYAEAFNQPIGSWDVSSVTTMRTMFMQAKSFNQPLADWDVSSVQRFGHMFNFDPVFNQPLPDWDVSSATDMYKMFEAATVFDQDITGWSTPAGIDSRQMFRSARAFFAKFTRTGSGTSDEGPPSQWHLSR